MSVGHFQTTEVVAFDCALETAADGVADDIDILASFKGGETGVFCWSLGTIFKTEFLNAALRSGAGFLKAGEIRLVHSEFLLIVKTHLNSGVAVGFRGFDLENSVSGYVDDGNRNAGAGFFVEDAGHA